LSTYRPNYSSRTAVVLFSRSHHYGVKNIFGGFKKSKSVHSVLDKKCKLTLANQPLDVFHISGALQKGNTFGQRISNAISDCFKKGYDKLIVIGNDCLTLTESDISRTDELLRESEIVLGKDRRGGAYLIGITRAAFFKEQFENLSWQSSSLVLDLVRYSENLNLRSTSLKEIYRDLNTQADLFSLITELKSSALVTDLLDIWISYVSPFSARFYSAVIVAQSKSCFGLRAPPQISFL